MGWILVVLDVVFMIGVGCGLCLGDTVVVIVLLRAVHVGIESMHGNNEVQNNL